MNKLKVIAKGRRLLPIISFVGDLVEALVITIILYTGDALASVV